MSKAGEIVSRAVAAAAAFRRLDQEQTDAVVRAAYLRALEQRVALARLAHEETGIGVWEHKVLKNVIATQLVYEDIKNEKTVGVVSEDHKNGVMEVAQSLGAVLGFIPITNPTATTIFKVLIALKTRNALIISPHPAGKRCTAAAAQACYEAARAAGAPEDCVQWLAKPTLELTTELMGDPRLALILATGTDALVRRATRSGTPTIGVGPGNVPVYIGATADVPFAVSNIIASKTFDNGTVCASEQAIVAKQEIAPRVIEEFQRQRAYFLSDEEADKVGRIAFDAEQGIMTPTIVGQPVQRIARSAGIDAPDDAVLLIARLEGVGRGHPLSAETLAPILAFYVVEDFETAIQRCTEITRFGGIGHTAVIYSNNQERIEHFSRTIQAGRILVNMPSTFGALGGMYNTLRPSFTLSCGSGGNNITTDNITTRHLLNIHRITRRRPNPRWMSIDHGRYLDEGVEAIDLEAEFNRNF